jgi:hypothetical protein
MIAFVSKAMRLTLLLLIFLLPVRGYGSDQAHLIVEHLGICDASGVVDLEHGRFAVADDELNLLLVYEAHGTGNAIYQTEISRFLDVVKEKKKKKLQQRKQIKVKEVDIEGATRVGDTVYWIASHGRKASGKVATERMRFFATSIVGAADRIELLPKGIPYDGLLQDLLEDPRYARLGLVAAAEKAPKTPGGLSIEAITNTLDGALLIGFRNPVIDGHALVAPMINPEEVLEGEKAKFGEPMLVDLDGNGIRGLSSHNGDFLIAANDPEGDEHTPKLFRWDGNAPHAAPIQSLHFGDLNPEALAILPDYREGTVLVLSDDGNRPIGPDQCKCKDLKDRSRRRFRSVTFDYSELHVAPNNP